ncbi:MAG: AAA family ATPase, partial [Pseudomonadota bacterium]
MPLLEYRGARFYKCDLHMHTPAEPQNWRGQQMDTDEAGMRIAADEYIQRCYESGLEVIAITDHNFASKQFIPFLRQSIVNMVPKFNYRIVLFPGFEFYANVGKGCHCLVLFDPKADLETIDHTLTQCGVDHPRFEGRTPERSKKNLTEILETIQKKGENGLLSGIVICPHSKSDAGIFDNARIADWLQQDEFKNSDLYCIEVPKAPDAMKEGWQKLFGAGADCDPAWRRIRPIACIMSSDAKALTPDGTKENYIGFRHTWIKMGEPSVEALRQAFLDPASRIRYSAESPEGAYAYPKITRLQVKGAKFLADQDFTFSPNLTTIIGGRGTGKSTISEYLRKTLDQELSIRGDEPRKNFQKIMGTVDGDTSITVHIEKERQTWKIQSVGGKQPCVIEGNKIPDISKFFPTQILSQREVYAIAEDVSARNRLVDDAIRSDLDEISRHEKDLLERIRDLNRQIHSLGGLQQTEKELETEHQDFSVRLKRLEELEGPLSKWKGFLAEKRFFDSLEKETTTAVESLRRVIRDTRISSIDIPNELKKGPNGELVAEIAEAAENLVNNLKTQAAKLIEDFQTAIRELHQGEKS